MNSFQQQLKHLRQEQQLTIDGAASKMSFTAQTIQMLEDTDDLFSLNLPTQSLKNYYRKYGECLGTPERKIVSMLNRIDYLDYKRSRKGKIKPFDYLNRLVILALIALLSHTVYTLYQQQKANALKQSVVTVNAPVVSTPSEQDTRNPSPRSGQINKSNALTPSTTISNTSTNDTAEPSKPVTPINAPIATDTPATDTVPPEETEESQAIATDTAPPKETEESKVIATQDRSTEQQNAQ